MRRRSGDEAIRDTLFRDRPHGLDAQELANALQQSMGVHMDTLGDTNAVHACSKRLLRRFCAHDAASASAGASVDKVTAEAMLSWIQTRFHEYQHEQLLSDLELHVVLARHSLPPRALLDQGQRSGVVSLDEIVNQSRESVRANVLAAVDEITDSIHGTYKELKDARNSAQAASSNAKFAGDVLDGTFEGTNRRRRSTKVSTSRSAFLTSTRCKPCWTSTRTEPTPTSSTRRATTTSQQRRV